MLVTSDTAHPLVWIRNSLKNSLPSLTFVIGGAASGKSRYAESLCISSSLERVYLATSQVYDAEMAAKVSKHVAQRGAGWRTIEAPVDLAPTLTEAKAGEVVLLDCLTLWLTNVILGDYDLPKETARLLSALDACNAAVVVVSNEVGQGIVPDNALSRKFRNAQGQLNQTIAARADDVVAVMAGLPLALKGAARR